MPTIPQQFSEDDLTELLRALRVRAAAFPDNPGLIASWPGVREDQMSAACAELLARGHEVFRVSIPRAQSGMSRDVWVLRAATDRPSEISRLSPQPARPRTVGAGDPGRWFFE